MKKEKSQQTGVVQKKKRKKAPIIIAIIVIAVVIIGMISCSLSAVGSAAVVTTTYAVRDDIQESIATSGTVVSEEEKVFFAPVSGKIASVEVAAGDAVSKGSVLISYDMEQMQNTMTQADLQQKKSEAGYNSVLSNNSKNQQKLQEANTNLDVLKQQIADNKAYLETLQNKLEKIQRDSSVGLATENFNLQEQLTGLKNQLDGIQDKTSQEYADTAQKMQEVNEKITRVQYQQSVASSSEDLAKLNKEIAEVQQKITEYETYKSQMEAQKSSSETAVLDGYTRTQYAAEQELAEKNHKQAEDEYNEAKDGICADFDGIVTECSVVPGATVAEGTRLLTLENSNEIKVSFKASKQDIQKLELGQKADITIGGNTYQGEVQKINRMAEKNESNTPMVGVEVHITNPDDKIILGMDAKLTIYTKNSTNALLVPVEAINGDRDGDFLYVAENGMVVRKPVTCGISSDTYIEILDGITENDQIIVTAYTSIEEGMAVTAIPEM